MKDLLSKLTTYHLKEAYHTLLNSVLSNIRTVERLDRAYDILTRDKRYTVEYISGNPVTFQVKGPNDTYTVINSQRLCTCPDTDILCKHRLIVSLILNSINLQRKDGISVSIVEDSHINPEGDK